MVTGNLKKIASIDAQHILIAPTKVSEEDKIVEYDALFRHLLFLVIIYLSFRGWKNLCIDLVLQHLPKPFIFFHRLRKRNPLISM